MAGKIARRKPTEQCGRCKHWQDKPDAAGSRCYMFKRPSISRYTRACTCFYDEKRARKLKDVFLLGEIATEMCLRRVPRDVCGVCGQPLAAGEQLYLGFDMNNCSVGVLHDRCLDAQARSVIKVCEIR
jgi:hypothetical protein